MQKEEEYIQEDWERIWKLDSMYIMEKQAEIEEEYYLWEQEQERIKMLPARINIIEIETEKKKENERNY